MVTVPGSGTGTSIGSGAGTSIGSGIGTFRGVYQLYEDHDQLDSVRINHAHNDFLELWLEAGVAGIGLVALFAVWLAVRAVKLWRRNAPGSEIDLSIARAATLVVVLIAAHSFVDYPLRTGAVMAIMAFACGLLVAPPLGGSRISDEERSRRSLRAPQKAPARPPPAPRPADAPISQHSSERWGSDIEWPEEWR